MPTEYYVIIDDKVMIVGLYQPTADDWGDVIEPFLIQGTSSEGAKIIKKYITRFDQMKLLLDEKHER